MTERLNWLNWLTVTKCHKLSGLKQWTFILSKGQKSKIKILARPRSLETLCKRSFLPIYFLVSRSCPTLCNPMDCSPLVSSVHGISQARILEWIAISFSKSLPDPRIEPWFSCIASRFFTLWASLNSSVGKESTYNTGDFSSIPGSGRSAGEGIGYPFQYSWASVVAQLVKNLPEMWETWVQPLGWEDPLEKGRATHSSIVAWRFPWTV